MQNWNLRGNSTFGRFDTENSWWKFAAITVVSGADLDSRNKTNMYSNKYYGNETLSHLIHRMTWWAANFQSAKPVFYAATSNIALLFLAMRTDLMDVGLTIARKRLTAAQCPPWITSSKRTRADTATSHVFVSFNWTSHLSYSIPFPSFPFLFPVPRSPDTTKIPYHSSCRTAVTKNNNSSSHHQYVRDIQETRRRLSNV